MSAKHRPLSTLYIPEARYITPEGKTEWIVPALEGEAVAPGRVAYDPSVHHMKLKCSHCNVRIDFNKGAGIAAAGTQLKGARPHLKTAPKQDHEDTCTLPDSSSHESSSLFDKSLGYRLHLNSVFASADTLRPVYERAANGKVIANDPRLQPREEVRKDKDGNDIKVSIYRESIAVHTPEDFINLMRRGEFSRLKDSLVVNNTVIPWHDFAILDDKRLRHLVDRLRNGASHPVLLKVALYEPAEDTCAQSKKVFYERDQYGAHFIVPRVYLDGKQTADGGHETDPAFPSRGEYLVLGLPRLKIDQRSGAYFLNMSLKDPANAVPYYYDNIIEEGKARDAKRQASAAPAP